jgi:hypothetical protein
MKLSELTKEWIGTPFAEISCIGFAHDFLEEATGETIPDTFGELSVDNYREAWRKDPAEVEAKMLEAIKACTFEHNIRFPKLLDLLVIEIKGHGLIPAVYVGNGNAIACFIKTGVTVFNIDAYNRIVWAGGIKS